MGILCELFMASPDEALAFESSYSSDVRQYDYAVVELRGLTKVDLDTLIAILDDENGRADKARLEEVSRGEESWLLKFPDRPVEILSMLEPAAVAAVAAKWSKADGIVLSEKETRSIVERLIRLARNARRQSKDMYMWGSL